jgi:hypothetical protein
LALAAVFACKINTDENQPVAIDVLLPDSARVEVTDTFRPSARALNGVGDSIPAAFVWHSLDTATLVVLDSATGVSLGKAIGLARLQARTGNLISNPQSVRVLLHLDSIRILGVARDTVFVSPVPPNTARDSVSDSLEVQAFGSGGAIPVNQRVLFAATTFPATAPPVTLLPKDTAFTNSATGVAVAQVRLQPGPVPDSAVITATMLHVNGKPVNGSPLFFVVEFRP